MFCSRCGTEVQENSKFCPSCGLDLGAQTPLGRVSTKETDEKTEIDLVKDALKDEYEIHQELGRGGMAIVFKARDKQLDRDVAVKVLPFSLAFDAEFVERFQREARTAARLEHPAIIPIYRVGKSGRVIYFVMKFLRGACLSDVIEQRGTLPPEEIRELLVPTAAALGYAHKNGIVHRDIKPDNIMFDEMGHAVVTDFGIAKAASGTRLTGTGMSIGTPHYMSPEQARAQDLDGRSDIYSLGVVAYQCLTGHVPFDGEDAFSIGYKHIMEEVEEPQLPSAEHRELFHVIRRMMAKSTDERYQNAEELVDELKGRPSQMATKPADVSTAPTVALSAVEAPQTEPSEPAVLARPSTPTTPMPRTEPPPPAAPKKKRRGGLIAASLVVILGGGGYGGYYYYTNYMQQSGSDPSAGPTQLATVDSPQVARLDTMAIDSAAAPGDSATPPPDTAPTPPARVLPDSGWLVVTGAPRGARFYVDGTAQRSNRVRLGIGSYRLEVKATNYVDHSENIAIGRGDSIVRPVRLERVSEPPPTVIGDPTPPQPSRPVVQCNSPTQRNYNSDGSCYDNLPRHLGSPQVPLNASVGDNPTPVTLWIKVTAQGRAVSRTPAQPSSDAAFTLLVMQYAMESSYQPATKNGQAVDAWIQVRFFPGQR